MYKCKEYGVLLQKRLIYDITESIYCTNNESTEKAL